MLVCLFLLSTLLSSAIGRSCRTAKVTEVRFVDFKCTADDKFRVKQCIKDPTTNEMLCHCVDQDSGRTIQTFLNQKDVGVDCTCALRNEWYDYPPKDVYKADCNIMSGHFIKKCVPKKGGDDDRVLLPGERPGPPKQCHGGFYKPVQCNPWQCICHDKYTGKGLWQYTANDNTQQRGMNCRCAQDEIDQNKRLGCVINGNYPTCVDVKAGGRQRVTCDENGNYVTKKCSPRGTYCKCLHPVSGAVVSTKGGRRDVMAAFKCPATCADFKGTKFERTCDSKGHYEIKQCVTLNDEVTCVCVDRISGKEVSAKFRGPLSKKDSFKCPSTCAEKSKEVGAYLECSSDGNYKLKQCYFDHTGDLCTCVDKYTGQSLHQPFYLHPNPNITCPAKCISFAKKSLTCAQDGNYEAKQCAGQNCYCVDRLTGRKTQGSVKSGETCPSKCSDFTGRADALTCDSVGNYRRLQCYTTSAGTACFCVNRSTGQQTSTEFPYTATGKMPCCK